MRVQRSDIARQALVLALAFSTAGTTASGAAAQGATIGEPRYIVAFDADRVRHVRVTLDLVLRSTQLVMDTTGLGGPDGSVAAFVRELRAERGSGERAPVSVRKEGAGRWVLDARPGDHVRISYRIALHHDSLASTGSPATDWSVPLVEVAFARRTLAYLTGRALFVTPPIERSEESLGARVELRLPAGWRAVTSWESRGGPTVFRAGDHGVLREGFVAAGPAKALEVTRHRTAGLALDVATWGSSAQAERDAITRTAASALGTYAAVFGRVPATARGTPYRRVAILVADEDAPARAGGALLRKDVVLLAPPGPARAPLLGAVAHQLFHLWNGRAFSHRSPAELWFAEGITEYYALHALRRAGVLSDSGYTEALDAAFSRFRRDSWIGVNSIAQGGQAIGAHRALVHDGGLLTAACMDPDIHTTTNGAHDLDDLMRALYERHDTGDRRYDNAAIYDALRTVADDAAARRITRVVEGSAPLSLWRCATEPGRR